MKVEAINDWVAVVLLGIVEGLTEFLPISSTGHLIVVSHFLVENSDATKLFEVFIQLGAILAICWHYRLRLLGILPTFFKLSSFSQSLGFILLIGFLPAAVLGLLFHDIIKTNLFSPFSVSIALILGGIAIIVIEKRPQKNKIQSVEAIRWQDALVIGFSQSLALFPGVSRSGATIMGGMVWGVNRVVATEFSFLLAIPTMFAAAFYDLYRNSDILNASLGKEMFVGLSISFITALLTIRIVLKFISNHSFIIFGWYRIIFGCVIMIILYI